ncbi:hypothetical protein Syun_025252 [Stephania yunnanensis]|uniref:Uncharacterized protein n=1 Tax=Stephania yunnanensis TaxID=152371 RepID=A0AAP0EWQ3_9MAGN
MIHINLVMKLENVTIWWAFSEGKAFSQMPNACHTTPHFVEDYVFLHQKRAYQTKF